MTVIDRVKQRRLTVHIVRSNRRWLAEQQWERAGFVSAFQAASKSGPGVGLTFGKNSTRVEVELGPKGSASTESLIEKAFAEAAKRGVPPRWLQNVASKLIMPQKGKL